MKGLAPLFLGIFGTFAFSWVGLTVIPNWQIGHLNPQSDEEGTDIYPMPQSGMVTRGARVYAANGCNYCHSQQVRAEYSGADIERKWGDRRSAPRDYIFERPVLSREDAHGPGPGEHRRTRAKGRGKSFARGRGKSRATSSGGLPGRRRLGEGGSPPPSAAASPSPATAAATSPGAIASKPPTSPGPASSPPSKSPATAGAGGTSPAAAASPPAAGPPWPEQTAGLPPMYSAAWHHVHLYSPRSINLDSNMPSYRFLYRARRISAGRSSDALQLTGSDVPPEGWEIVPTFDARCLVAYMMALNQSHPLKDVRSAGAPAAASPAASPSPAPGGQPAK